MSYPNPTQSRVKPQEGNGTLEAKIFFKSILLGTDEAFLIRTLYYEYLETVNGLEVFIENPDIQNASSLDEDIREAVKTELKSNGVSFDNLVINFYEPK